MSGKRTVEIFSAGCGVCDETVALVRQIACNSCEVSVLDMRDEQVATRARSLVIRAVPAVVVDGALAGCCENAGPTESALREAGIGRAL